MSIRILFAEIGTGNRQKKGFVDENRHIVSVKKMVGYAATNYSRNAKKYQNSQFTTNVHPRLPLQTLVYIQLPLIGLFTKNLNNY